NFAHRGTAEEGVFFTRNEGDHFDIGRQPLVGQGHTELKFEIGKDSQAAHNHLCAHGIGEINGQAAVRLDGDILPAVQRLLNHGYALLHGEEQRFRRDAVVIDANDQFVEDGGGAVHQVEMAIMHGIKGAGIDGANFQVSAPVKNSSVITYN